MKLLLFGALGMIGSRILDEALRRGHKVTVVVRDPKRMHRTDEKLTVLKGDVLEEMGVVSSARGHDAVLAAVGPGPDVIVGATRLLLEALPQAKVTRLVVVGGAGSLEVAPGKLFVNSSDFPKEYLDQARANCQALELFRKNELLEWTVVSPPIWIAPGTRGGEFRLGSDQLLVNSNGESRISAEDFAVAFLDEVENPRHVRTRFTVAS